MILSDKQLREVTLGALEIYTEDGLYRFKRMTDAQGEEFVRENSDFANKTRATSGVRFDFYTDSDYIVVEFGGVLSGSSRKMLSFDICVDGNLHTSFFRSNMDVLEGKIRADFEKGEKHIQFFLPCLANAGIKSVELSDGAYVKPFQPKYKMLVLGDSITQGYTAYNTSRCYANLMARKLDAEIVNQAIGGARFYKEQLEKTQDYDIVTVAYGTNDWSGKDSFKTFYDDCEEYIKLLSEQHPNAKKFIILPIWRAHHHYPKPTGNFFVCRDAIAQIAERYGCIALESIDYVPHDSVFFEDETLHPNDIGFEAYAVKLVNDIKKYL